MAFLDDIQKALTSGNPLVERTAGGGAGALAGASIARIFGLKGKGTGILATIGGVGGAVVGPQVFDFLQGGGIAEVIQKQADNVVGIKGPIGDALQASIGVQGGVVALARGKGRGSPAFGRILQREQARLRASQLEPFNPFSFLFG